MSKDLIGFPETADWVQPASPAPVGDCKHCKGTGRATYFSEQGWKHEERDCHMCRSPAPVGDGLVNRLKDMDGDDHERGCQGRCYSCECGYDERKDELIRESAATITRLEQENQWLRKEIAESHQK